MKPATFVQPRAVLPPLCLAIALATVTGAAQQRPATAAPLPAADPPALEGGLSTAVAQADRGRERHEQDERRERHEQRNAPEERGQRHRDDGDSRRAADDEHRGEQGEELEEVVVSAVIGTYYESTSQMASKMPMEIRDLASSLSIMNESAIRDRNAVALTDVFNYVVGATQSQGNINGFSFRGFPNTGSYTQNIQFDGLLGATLKKAATSAANVDSLEFLKGPNGVMYGQMNPGGLLNIVSKSPLERAQYGLRLSLGQYAGAFRSRAGDVFNLNFDATGPIAGSEKLFYRLVVDGGETPSSRPGNHSKSRSIYPSLMFKWSEDTSLLIKAEDSDDRRRQDDGVVPIFTGGTAFGPNATWTTAPLDTVYNNSDDWAHDYGSAIAAVFRTKVDDWNFRVQTRSVWHVDQVYEFTVNNANVYNPMAAFATPTTTLRRQFNNVKNGHRYNFADASVHRAFGPESFQHTILFGLSGGGEAFYNNRIAFGPNTTVAQAIALINPVIDLYSYPTTGIIGQRYEVTRQTMFGQYLADQIKVGDKLNISLGVRREMLKAYGADFHKEITPITGQAGIVYDVTPAIAVYGSWSESAKPQTTVSFNPQGGTDFPPESGEQFEIGAKIQSADANMNLTLAAYQITRTNVVVPSGTNFQANDPAVLSGLVVVGTPISRLDGKQRSRGYEIELQYQPMQNWQLQLGYAHSDAKILESLRNPASVGLNLANAPTDTGNFWTRYNIPNGRFAGLGFGGGVIYVGEAFAGDPTTAVYYLMPAWTRVDASAYYKWGRYDVALNIQNALDRRYIASAQSALTLNVGEQRKMTLSFGMKF